MRKHLKLYIFVSVIALLMLACSVAMAKTVTTYVHETGTREWIEYALTVDAESVGNELVVSYQLVRNGGGTFYGGM